MILIQFFWDGCLSVPDSLSKVTVSCFLLLLIQMMMIAIGDARHTSPQKTARQIKKMTHLNMRLSLFYSWFANQALSSSNGSPDRSWLKEGSVTNFSTVILDLVFFITSPLPMTTDGTGLNSSLSIFSSSSSCGIDLHYKLPLSSMSGSATSPFLHVSPTTRVIK